MVKASFRLLSSLIALLCVVFLTLQVPSIKKDLIVWLVNKVLNEPDHQILIEEVEGIFPFSIKISSLKIKDQKGIWLNLEQLNIKIFYLPFKIDFIHLKNLEILHRPQFNSPSIDPLPLIPVILHQNYFQELIIYHINISSNLWGTALEGSLQWKPDSTNGQYLVLKTSLGSILTTITQLQANHICFKNTEILYQDYKLKGNIEIDYKDLQLLKNKAELTLSHPNLPGDIPFHYQLTCHSFQNFILQGDVHLEQLSLPKDWLGNVINYQVEIDLNPQQSMKIKSFQFSDQHYHSLNGEGYLNLISHEVQGKLDYNFLGNSTIDKKQMTADLSGNFDHLLAKLNLHDPQILMEVNWEKVTQQLNFQFLTPKIKGKTGKITQFSGKGSIDTFLNGETSLEMSGTKIKGIKIGKSGLKLQLKKGEGTYQFYVEPYGQEDSFTFNSKGQFNLNQNTPYLNGQMNFKTIIARSKKKTGKLSGKNIEVKSQFNWSSSHLKGEAVYTAGHDKPLIISALMELENGKLSSVAPYQIKAQGEFNLSSLMPIITNGDRLSGKAAINLILSGKGSTTNLTGSIKILKGFYEIAEFGTCIGNINAEFQAKGTRLVIQNLQASDGTKRSDNHGQLNGQGFIDLKDLFNPFLNIDLSLNDYQVAASDSFFARAGGTISFKGIGEKAKVEGVVTLNPVGLLLEEVNPVPTIPTIKIVNENASKGKKNNSKNDLKIFPINLKLKAPKKFMIQGFGLESLWEGELDVVNYLSEPQLLGGIKIVKGKLDLLGKVMRISKGEISYEENFLNNPKLYLVATRDVDGTLINILVEGRASNPKFTFTSIPALPEEEILSRLLFGKELNKISAAQSLQLAAAVASMNGQKGLNIMDKVRSSFGLDILEIKESEAEGDKKASQALSIGKEFGKMRVSIDQTINGAGGSKATLSTALTPSLNLNIDVGGSQSSGVGLSWEKRY